MYVKYICELYVYTLQKGIIYLPRDFFFLPGELDGVLGGGGRGGRAALQMRRRILHDATSHLLFCICFEIHFQVK